MPKIRVGKQGIIVIPKEVREKLGIEEGMVLDLEVDDDKIIIRVRDLWSELRRRGLNMKVNLDEVERELLEDEESWLGRIKP